MDWLYTKKPAVAASNRIPPKWLRVLGMFWIITGAVAILSAFAATMATVLLIGVLLLLAGLAQFAHIFADRAPGLAWRLLTGTLYTVAGILLIADPVDGAIGLTLLIAMLFLASGAVRFLMAAKARQLRVSAGWHLTGGFINICLAALVFAGWPETGTWVIGLFVGIEMLLGGLTLLFAPQEIFGHPGSGKGRQ